MVSLKYLHRKRDAIEHELENCRNENPDLMSELEAIEAEILKEGDSPCGMT